MLRRIGNSQRTSGNKNEDRRFAGSSDSLNELILESYEVYIAAIRIFSSGTFHPSFAHHILSGHDNIEIGFLSFRFCASYLSRAHVLRIPTLINEVYIRLR